MSANQDHINAVVGALTEDLDTVKAEIQTLKDQAAAAGADLDFTALDDFVSKLDAVAHPPTEEPTPEPEPAPETPGEPTV
ncbi:hypothetical protein [Frankia sp. R82]|uniref:hypothetical protein n=1 Tax=Frankia sp. R82 TaxID=2950553 RepID=UPI002043F3DB|nr:hypothetical protein [Frankia sp. R82]MCM3884168.1 hypothetical protein [Frankia sp. R82]